MHDFWVGGLAALTSITVVHPIDVCKSRYQVAGEARGHSTPPASTGLATTTKPSIPRLLGTIAREQGIRGLYSGLLPAYALQFSVTATRFGVYRVLKELAPDRSTPSALHDFALAGLSGSFSGIVGTPFFALKTRFQTHQGERLNLVKAFLDIHRQEGLLGYFRGLSAFVPRVCVYGAVQIASYDAAKRQIGFSFGLHKDAVMLHLSSSVVAATLAVLAIQPFDFIAVRLMNQPVKADGSPMLYNGFLDCVRKSIRQQGPLVVFSGLGANVARFLPYTIMVLVFFDRFKILFGDNPKQNDDPL